jgi:phosphatidate phosphatase APP1
MKKMFILLSVLLTFQSFAGIRIVSDMDDTIKVTHSDSGRAVFHALFQKRAFAGMAELMRYMRERSEELVVLTASPNILRKKITKTLRHHSIPVDQIILRTAKDKEKFTYKVNKVTEMMESNDDDYILIGDDIGQDPEAYAEIKKRFGDRVVAIYIRPMKNREKFAGQIQYITSYDIARSEYLAGRMSLLDLKDIAYLIRVEENKRNVIPKRFYCPSTGTVYAGVVPDVESEERVKTVVANICKK